MSDRAAIKQTLIDLIEADTGINHAQLDEATNLRTDLGLDSVDVISIVSQIERQYRIHLSQDDLKKLVVVRDFLDLLESKLLPIAKAA